MGDLCELLRTYQEIAGDLEKKKEENKLFVSAANLTNSRRRTNYNFWFCIFVHNKKREGLFYIALKF